MYIKTREIVYFDLTTNPVKCFVEQSIEEMMWKRDYKNIHLIYDWAGEFCFIDYKSCNITDVTTS